jgi:hypothetical protein
VYSDYDDDDIILFLARGALEFVLHKEMKNWDDDHPSDIQK